MNWDDLATFLALYRGGSYAAAGRALGINSTTVARRVERLSESVGAVLFVASADGLVPTPAAEAIHPSAVAMERQATLIERQMSGDAQSLSGSVRLTTSGDFVTHFLVPHLPELLSRHPRLQLELVVGDRFVDLAAGDADIAVRFTRQGRGMPLGPSESPDGVVGRLLTPLATALVASKAYIEHRGRPEPGAPLDGHDVILQTGAQNLPGMVHLAGRSERAHVVLRCDSFSMMTEAAAHGLGIAATPWFMVARHSTLEVLEPEVDQGAAWLLIAKDLRRVARVRAVRDFLVELFVRWGGYFAGDEYAAPQLDRAGGPESHA